MEEAPFGRETAWCPQEQTLAAASSSLFYIALSARGGTGSRRAAAWATRAIFYGHRRAARRAAGSSAVTGHLIPGLKRTYCIGGNLSPVATDRHSAQRHSICVSRRPPKGLVHEHVSRRPRSLRSTSEQCDPGVAGVCGRSRQRHAKGEVQMRYSEIRHAPRHAQPRA